MASIMKQWHKGGHAERSFSRLVKLSNSHSKKIYHVLVRIFLVFPDRWCQDTCTVHPDEVQIPLKVTNEHGDDIEVLDCTTSILWPWDIFEWIWDTGYFLQWISDDPKTASDRTEEYWLHCAHLNFFKELNLQRDQLRNTVPLFIHADGVRIYKAQKAWVYSISSSCRKGGSLKTKLVVIVLRENRIIKEKSHDAVGLLMAYICDTLMSGQFPKLRPDGTAFPPGSKEAKRIGKFFAGGWRFAFAGFKGDWEARVVIHKSKRNYNSTWICDHCMASRVPDFTFGDFRMSASCLNHRFTHAEYLIMQGDKQSTWRYVKGWDKDRNLEDP